MDIMEFFRALEKKEHLIIDIRFDGRFEPENWADFLSSCKGTVATEAGSAYLERDDHTVHAIVDYLQSETYSPSRKRFESLRYRLNRSRLLAPLVGLIKQFVPRKIKSSVPWDGFLANVPFDHIYDRFFKEYKNPVSGKCISSRHFEAIGTETLQIMFPGRFNDILEADTHYLALNRDYSNIDDVLARFRDDSHRLEIVRTTREHILSAHTHAHRITRLIEAVS